MFKVKETIRNVTKCLLAAEKIVFLLKVTDLYQVFISFILKKSKDFDLF